MDGWRLDRVGHDLDGDDRGYEAMPLMGAAVDGEESQSSFRRLRDAQRAQSKPETEESPQRRRRVRPFILTGLLIVALAALGAMLWQTYRSPSVASSSGEVPVLRADPDPVRLAPEDPGGLDVPHQDRLVLEDVDGSGGMPLLNGQAESPEEPMIAEIDAMRSRDADAGPAESGAEAAGQIVPLPEAATDFELSVEPDPAAETEAAAQSGAVAEPEAAEPPQPAEADGAADPVVAATGAEPGDAAVGEAEAVAQADDRDADGIGAAEAPPPADVGTDASAGSEADGTLADARGSADPDAAPVQADEAPSAVEGLAEPVAPVLPRDDAVASDPGIEAVGDVAAPPAETAADVATENPAAPNPLDEATSLDDFIEALIPRQVPEPVVAEEPPAEPEPVETAPEVETAEPEPREPNRLIGATWAELPRFHSMTVALTLPQPPRTVVGVPIAGDEPVVRPLVPVPGGTVADALAVAAFAPPMPVPQAEEAAAVAPEAVEPEAVEPEAVEPEAVDAPAEAVAAVPPQPEQTAAFVSRPDGTHRVQVVAVQSEAEANSEWARFQSRYPDLLGGTDVFVGSIDLGDRGIWYRVMADGLSQADAGRLCAELQARGADCIVRSR